MFDDILTYAPPSLVLIILVIIFYCKVINKKPIRETINDLIHSWFKFNPHPKKDIVDTKTGKKIDRIPREYSPYINSTMGEKVDEFYSIIPNLSKGDLLKT